VEYLKPEERENVIEVYESLQKEPPEQISVLIPRHECRPLAARLCA
jgi:hypothetical protein